MKPGALWPPRGDDGGGSSGLQQLCCQVVEELPWGVAPVDLPAPFGVGEAEAVHGLRRAVSPLGVVALDLAVGLGGEPVDRVASPQLVHEGKHARGQLPVVAVELPAQPICPKVGGGADVAGEDTDPVGVEEVEELAQLGHQHRRSRRQVGQNVDDGHVVLVETEAVSAELGEEGLHGATHSSELLPSDVVGDLVVAPKAPGLVGLVQDSTPAEAAGVAVEV